MAEFEDSNSPTWENCVNGQVNLHDAIRKNIDFTADNGKEYKLNKSPATLFVRPRGLHLQEKNFLTEIEGILNPKLSFKKMLQRFFGKFGAKTRRTYAKPNRRNLFQPNMFPLPGKRGSQPSLYLLLDTSGSMWDPEGFDLVKGALGIIKNLVNNGGYRVRIIMCDTEVKEDLDFDQVQKVIAQKNLKALGGGGSDFRDAFDYIWKDALYNNNAQAPIICITDGYIDVPEKQAKMRTSTAWVTPKGVKPPTTKWGDHMEMIL